MNFFFDYLIANGIPIDFGSRQDFALSRSKAIAALETLREQEAIVLGGDSFELRDNRLVSTHAGWHCDALISEDKKAFSERSISAARDYLIRYQEAEVESYFVFVVQ